MYIVLTKVTDMGLVGDKRWLNTWSATIDGDDVPQTYKTREEAEEAIVMMVEGLNCGEISDYRIMKVVKPDTRWVHKRGK